MDKTFNCWEPLPSEAENYLSNCLNEKNFSDNAKELFAKRYYVPYFDTSTNEMNKESKLDQLIKRVGRIVASGLVREFNTQNNWLKIKSSDYDDTCLKEKFLALMKIVEFNIRKDISLKRFLFNSPALFSSGVGLVEKEMSSRIIYDVKVEDMTFSNYEYLFNNKSPYQQLCACFVIDVDDDLNSIFDSVKEAAIISKFCGGVGINWSSLREKNAPIKDGSIGNSSGPVSFMELWNTMGKVVVQGGKRRSAIMSMMDIDHPDIQEFIHAKEHDGNLQYFNISTRLDNEFINAVKQKKPYYLKSRLGKDVNLSDGIKREMKLTQIDANELFDEICTCAHKNGEPGIIFGDKINQDNLLKHLPEWQIKATNPCVSGDTLIAVADGRHFVSFEELAKEGKDVPVYCRDENGNTTISMMRNPRITGYEEDVYKICLDDETYFEATGNHKILTKNRGYVEVKDLKLNESLTVNSKSFEKYIKLTEFEGNKKSQLEHRIFYKYFVNDPMDFVIHHLDENPHNNQITNLILAGSPGEHTKKYHQDKNPFNNPEIQKSIREKYHIGAKRLEETKKLIGQKTKERFQNAEFKEKFSLAVKKSMTDEVCKKISEKKKKTPESKLAEAQSNTDLFCFLENDRVMVRKVCENCGNEFTIPYNRREVAFCSSCRYEIGYQKQRKIREMARNSNYEIAREFLAKYICEYNTIPQKKSFVEDLKNEKNINFRSTGFTKYSDFINQIRSELELNNDDLDWIIIFKHPILLRQMAKELKQKGFVYNHKIVSIEYIGKKIVYNGTVDNHHTYLFAPRPINKDFSFEGRIFLITSVNCGEQPLSAYTSCNLGSINLEAFVNKNENEENFSDFDFIRQIHRSILYLDCVVDANSYPLKKIEERTQDIRPLGLGFMGLANAAIKLKMGYGSHNFNQFCKYIGKLMAKHSMYASIDLCEVMEFNSFKYAKEAISHYTSELTYDDLPPSIKMIFDEQENKDECRNKYLQLFLEGKLRNSRRLTIAPTGSISMLFDTSSGIEPNFAYQYDRRISKGHNVWEIVQYTHPLYMTKEEYENQKTSKDDNYEEVYIKANDLSIEKHMQPLKILSKYIDSAISKTINLPSEATVEDVKNIYLDAFDSSIKGVTVYRDSSRGSQPIVDTTKKEEKKENVDTLVKDNKHIYTGKVKERSQFMRSITTKMAVEPYGSIYLTTTLDENGNIFEIFSSIGKSGQMLKTMMEALSRIISIALRSGTNIQDVIGTLKFMSGTDRWIYDTFDKKEIEVNSIPDMLARMLEDIQKHFTGTGEKLETIESKHQEELTIHGDICPECGKELSHYDGCKICWSCQYSACK